MWFNKALAAHYEKGIEASEVEEKEPCSDCGKHHPNNLLDLLEEIFGEKK